LERLKIYQDKIEKELKKLPDTSNRKPRIALREKIGAGRVCLSKLMSLPISNCPPWKLAEHEKNEKKKALSK
jgi:hypothetical protein